MSRALIIIIIFCRFFIQISSAANICTSYNEISLEERNNISNIRYDLELIKQDISDIEYKTQFNEVINSRANEFINSSMKNYLQGLVAEALFRRYVYKSIGLDQLSYKRFQIFADLILDHKAMDYKGFVNLEQFSKVRTNLEYVINDYFRKKEIPFINGIKFKDKNLITKIKAKAFVEIENNRLSMLGAIDLIWINLLQRNQINKTEVMSDLAVADLSVNAATAVVGFAGMVGYGPGLLKAAETLWTMPLSIAAGCGFGVGLTYFTDGINVSYLDMSRALYKSVQSRTSFACELGEQATRKTKNDSIVKIPNEVKSVTANNYLMACAAVGSSMIFPKTLSIAFSGMQIASLTTSSYQLLKEAIVILEEVPKLYRLKKERNEGLDHDALIELETKIQESKAKITLYMLAFGGTSITEFRMGLFLYGGKSTLLDIIHKAEIFIKTSPINKSSNIQFMKLILTQLQSL